LIYVYILKKGEVSGHVTFFLKGCTTLLLGLCARGNPIQAALQSPSFLAPAAKNFSSGEVATLISSFFLFTFILFPILATVDVNVVGARVQTSFKFAQNVIAVDFLFGENCFLAAGERVFSRPF